MKTIAMFFATREGQTRRIANYISQKLHDLGHDVEIIDLANPMGIQLEHYDGAILAASVHMWRHEPEMAKFVRANRLKLATMPTAFLSVSLCEAGAEDPSLDSIVQLRAKMDAAWLRDSFFAATRWHPDMAESVAGALRYSQYRPVGRLIMQQIARLYGRPTDTSKDHELTNWERLDDIATRFSKLLTGVPVPSFKPAEPRAEEPAPA